MLLFSPAVRVFMAKLIDNFFKDQVKNDAAELEPVEQKSEPVVDEIDALIAQTEAVAQELDEAEVSEGRLRFKY